MKDNGGRRSVSDRRKCTDFDHFPERRALRFRRSDLDRRKGWAENSRIKIERRANYYLFSPKLEPISKMHLTLDGKILNP